MTQRSRGKAGTGARRPRADATRRKRRVLLSLNAALILGLVGYIIFLSLPDDFSEFSGPQASSSQHDIAMATTPGGVEVPEPVAQCASCHVLPPPDILPKDRWPRMVKHMDALATQNDLAQPLTDRQIEQITSWYVERAPEQVKELKFEGAPSPIRFEPSAFGSRRIATDAGGPPIIGALRIVDLNRDGEPEVLISDIGNGRLTRVSRDVTGKWTERPLVDTPAPAQIAVADLTGDGHDDIVVADLGTIKPTDDPVGSVVLLTNDGEQNFTARTLQRDLPRVSDVQVADLNGNGRQDILFAAFGLYKTGQVGWLEQQPDGTFTHHPIDYRNGLSHVRVTDLNENGRPDFVALLSQEHQQVLAYINDGDGRFERRVIHQAPHPMWGYSSLEVADFNNDGRDDIILANGDIYDIEHSPQPFHGVQRLENTGDLEFVLHDVFNFYGAYTAVPADLTGDGNLDIVVTSMANKWDEDGRQSIIWLENDGSQNFHARRLSDSPTSQVAIAVGDLTGEGRPDLLTGGMYVTSHRTERMGRVTMWKNLGERDAPAADPR